MSGEKIYVLEHRSEGIGAAGTVCWESVIAFVGSSFEKCLDFVRENRDYDEKTDSKTWWWAIVAEIVDKKDPFFDNELCFFDSDGNRLENQPQWEGRKS